jgi:hypothetical protein
MGQTAISTSRRLSNSRSLSEGLSEMVSPGWLMTRRTGYRSHAIYLDLSASRSCSPNPSYSPALEATRLFQSILGSQCPPLLESVTSVHIKATQPSLTKSRRHHLTYTTALWHSDSATDHISQ